MLTWALRAHTGHAPSKMILMLLANYCDERGTCFPSIGKLAEQSELAVRTVGKAIEHLEGLGLLERTRDRRSDGTMTGNRFRLLLGDENAASDPSEKLNKQGALLEERHRHHVPVDTPSHRHDVPVDHRHVVPKPSARGAGGHIKHKHQSDPYERDARESAGQASEAKPPPVSDDDPRSDRAFTAFMDRWPTRTDDLERAFAAWRKLDADDKRRAVDGIDGFRLATRADGRSVICAAATYLRQHGWERVSASPSAGTTGQPLTAFGIAWWCIFHRRRRAGESVKFMLQQAASGKSYAVPPGGLPTADDEAALSKIAVGSPAFDAWREALADEGLRLPELSTPFAWMPGAWPEAEAAPAADPEGAWGVSSLGRWGAPPLWGTVADFFPGARRFRMD